MNRSAWWFLLPLIGGILGAAIAWSKLRTDDPEMVKWIMIFGAIQTIALAISGLSGGYYDPLLNGTMMTEPAMMIDP